MPLITEDAIVLTRYPFRDRSAVAVFLTKGRGVIRAVVRSFHGRRTALGALEPLAQVRLAMFISPRRELATANEVEVGKSWLELAKNPLSWAASQVAAELALEFCPPGVPQEGFYRLLEKTPLWLEGGADPWATVVYVHLWATKLAGILPHVASCAACQKSLGGGPIRYLPGTGFTCEGHGGGGLRISTSSFSFLQEALRLPLPELSRAPGEDLANVLILMVRHFLEKDLRSLAVFRELREKMLMG